MLRTVSWLLALALQATVLPAWPQTVPYPFRPVRLIVPFPPGGTADVLARVVGQRLTDRLGQPIIVEDKPGGGTLIAAEFVAKASGDGYTVLFTTSSAIAVLPHFHKKLPYDPFEDFVHVVQLCDVPLLLTVSSSMKARTLSDLLALARANPGKLTFASVGQGSAAHLAGEMFKVAGGVDLLHVPYRGAALATNGLLGGQVDVMFTGPSSAIPHIKAGRLRALGITGARRSSGLPDVPTIAEAGLKDFEYTVSFGLSVPRATPAAIAARLNAEVRAVVSTPEVAEKMIAQGVDPRTGTSEEFTAVLRKDWEKQAILARQIGFKPQ